MTGGFPPGFSASDYDHVEGPIREEELEGECPKCGEEYSMIVRYWRSAADTVACMACNYEWDRNDG